MLFGRWIILIYSGEHILPHTRLVALTVGLAFNYIRFGIVLVAFAGLARVSNLCHFDRWLAQTWFVISACRALWYSCRGRVAVVLLHCFGGHHGLARIERDREIGD